MRLDALSVRISLDRECLSINFAAEDAAIAPLLAEPEAADLFSILATCIFGEDARTAFLEIHRIYALTSPNPAAAHRSATALMAGSLRFSPKLAAVLIDVLMSQARLKSHPPERVRPVRRIHPGDIENAARGIIGVARRHLAQTIRIRRDVYDLDVPLALVPSLVRSVDVLRFMGDNAVEVSKILIEIKRCDAFIKSGRLGSERIHSDALFVLAKMMLPIYSKIAKFNESSIIDDKIPEPIRHLYRYLSNKENAVSAIVWGRGIKDVAKMVSAFGLPCEISSVFGENGKTIDGDWIESPVRKSSIIISHHEVCRCAELLREFWLSALNKSAPDANFLREALEKKVTSASRRVSNNEGSIEFIDLETMRRLLQEGA